MAAATKRIFEEAWGLDTSTLTKTQLVTKLIAHGCTVKVRGHPGDFKHSDSKQKLLNLLHSKMPVPSPHVSLDDFLASVEAKAQAEGDASVLAMASTQSAAIVSSPSSHTTPSVRRRTPQKDSGVGVPSSPSSDNGSDTSSSGDESTEDEQGIVCVGDEFVYSDEDEGDSTLTVRRIAHGGLVYVQEDEETLCLEYVRKKVLVRRSALRQTRGTRKSSRVRRKINYEKN